MMEIGLTYTSRTTVNSSNTAEAVGSGDLPVFATPAMIALMENAAAQAVKNSLPEGATTVGTAINITHTRATRPGETVAATAELHEINSRKLTFIVTAHDSQGIIGEGKHERVIVDIERFMNKL